MSYFEIFMYNTTKYRIDIQRLFFYLLYIIDILMLFLTMLDNITVIL
jgi:hypothetical protein